MEMIYFGCVYYISLGMATAFFMNKASPVDKLLGLIVIAFWPIMLPLAALGCFLIERKYPDVDSA